ncbi:MAG: LysE family translocator [Alphaproteobacteria bacterium]|jgi:threonine/homoserine/homoserine lactone efflux protein|nr:LysE family translocator [Alphaproteobacteria bacterium]MDP6567005.1 LysE family translocator [Alphaproteobacteria bacterium]MDP6812184.1 LysE family translocator [Alphaproteobacteria bacterium]
MSPEFLLTSFIVVIAPGTGVLYTLACGLAGGARSGVVGAFGCTMGILPHLTASIFGLAAVLHTSAVAFQVLKYAGVAYLLYMAWSALRESGVLAVENGSAPRSSRGIIVKGFLINILNPKLSIFFLAFLPQFIPTGASHPTLSMIFLGGIFMLMTFVVFVGYGLFSAGVRHHLVSRPGIMTGMRWLFAGAFAGLGLKLALAER